MYLPPREPVAWNTTLLYSVIIVCRTVEDLMKMPSHQVFVCTVQMRQRYLCVIVLRKSEYNAWFLVASFGAMCARGKNCHNIG